MSETAIPITHSIDSVVEFIGNTPINPSDKAVAQLALDPGWQIVEQEITQEIERLKAYEYLPGDSVEAYGFKALAASLCVAKLEWIKARVRETERAVRTAQSAE